MFPKYLTEYQNVKIVKSKFKSEKSNKNKHQCNLVLNEKKKKRERKKRNLNRRNVCYVTFNYLFTYFMHTYL